MTRKALVLGAGGFIGSHMVKRLKSEGYWVRGVDLKRPEFSSTYADEFIQGDLREADFVRKCLEYKGTGGKFYEEVPYKYVHAFDEVYQFAADMGGAGFVFTGENDADIMQNSVMINLNVLEQQRLLNREHERNYTKIFYSGSACMYPEHNQLDPNNPDCRESSAYPANPDSEYGWEKLFSERLYLAYNRNHGIPVRIGVTTIFLAPKEPGRVVGRKLQQQYAEKVAYAGNTDTIEVWGDGEQTRSFLYIDECIEATRKLMDSDFLGPINIGSEEMVTIKSVSRYSSKGCW